MSQPTRHWPLAKQGFLTSEQGKHILWLGENRTAKSAGVEVVVYALKDVFKFIDVIAPDVTAWCEFGEDIPSDHGHSIQGTNAGALFGHGYQTYQWLVIIFTTDVGEGWRCVLLEDATSLFAIEVQTTEDARPKFRRFGDLLAGWMNTATKLGIAVFSVNHDIVGVSCAQARTKFPNLVVNCSFANERNLKPLRASKPNLKVKLTPALTYMRNLTGTAQEKYGWNDAGMHRAGEFELYEGNLRTMWWAPDNRFVFVNGDEVHAGFGPALVQVRLCSCLRVRSCYLGTRTMF
jgi:hypothetical protein